MSVKDIADRIMAMRGLNAGDRSLRRNMVKRVGMALRYQRTNGIVREANGPGQCVLWGVTR